MAGARSKSRQPASTANLFATPEELADRNPNTSLFSTYGLPDDAPTSFTQIPPKSGSGSVNRAPLTRKSGDMKFSGGTGKP